MSFIPKNIESVIEEFSKLPGIGFKTAERLTFYLLKKPDDYIKRFGNTVAGLKEGIAYCEICKNLTAEPVCSVCSDDKRDKSILCIVEDVLDLVALEKANEYSGVYHVLHGLISPLDGVGPDELTIKELIERVKNGGINEVIIALNPSMEGEATTAYITRYIKPFNVRITRIARGIPVGGDLEYTDSQTLKRAFEGRVEY